MSLSDKEHDYYFLLLHCVVLSVTQTGNSSPKKRKSVNGGSKDLGQYPPIVILFEDLESFLPHVLQDYISICR